MPSGWVPEIKETYRNRFRDFQRELQNNFKSRKAPSNLSFLQERAKQWLLAHPEVTVLNADKNLGPITMDRDDYIKFAHKDHLQDKKSYTRLSEALKNERLASTFEKIHTFCEIWSEKKVISKMDTKYIRSNTAAEPAYMYLLAKIHKSPLKTRPIISYSGSVCSGIAKWLDVELKKLLPFFPYIATSSIKIAQELNSMNFPRGTQLFTMDATAMYTNIHLKHALPTLERFLCETERGKNIAAAADICPAALIHALEIVMDNNVFAFGDTYWLQIAGTAMGTPPAPTWATIYFCIWELIIIPEFPELIFYKRYIDDGFAAWLPNPLQDNEARLAAFQTRMQEFGIDHSFFQENDLQPLQWTFSAPSNSAVFLDLTITITDTKIHTTIFEKALNLYLYIPALSCHSKGVLRGLIFGMAHRAQNLCSDPADRVPFLLKCFNRLLKRGYEAKVIKPIFLAAIRKNISHSTPTLQDQASTTTPNQQSERPLFLHMPINPADPPSSTIQQLFSRTISTAHNPDDDLSQDCNNLTVCYHGQQSLKNILAPRKGRFGKGFSVSSALGELEEQM